MLDFNDTSGAFATKSNRDLKNAYILFSSMQISLLMKSAKSLSEFASRFGIPLSWAIKPTIYRHFVGGETIKDCTKVVNLLKGYNVKSVLDYSVEGGAGLSDVQNAYEETISSIEYARVNPGIAFAVFKPTAMVVESVLNRASEGIELLGEIEREEYENFRKRIFSLCQKASDCGVKILVDAEKFATQGLVDSVVEEAMRRFNKKRAIVFQTLQMYRRDRLDYLKYLYEDALNNNYIAGIKFVRGAYMDQERARAYELSYPDPILPDKQATDESFNEGLKFAMDNLSKFEIFCGTHNYRSNQLLAEMMESRGLRRDDERVFFSQLYGMSDNITFTLAREGYNTCKYIPYAPVEKVLPYLFRRMEENSSVSGQSTRELDLIKNEIRRRRG